MKKLVAFLMAMTMILCLFAGCAAEKTDPVHTTAGLPSKEGITIPKRNVSLKNDPAADMMLLFIYQGNCYVQYEIVQGTAIKGKRLGTVTGMIDEWTPADGYVELAGSAYGDFFEVEGYDPSFMLCMNEGEDAVMTYVCDSGFTVKQGADILEKRFHFSENRRVVWYRGRNASYAGSRRYQFTGSFDIVDEFIRQINEGEFVPRETLEGELRNKNPRYELLLITKSGIPATVYVFEDGYVCFSSFWDYCIWIPEETFNKMFDLMENHTDATAVS